MSAIIPMPWHAVRPFSQILGRAGEPVDVLDVWADEGDELAVIWRDRDRTGVTNVNPWAIVPVIVPALGDALGSLFRSFPTSDVLRVEA